MGSTLSRSPRHKSTKKETNIAAGTSGKNSATHKDRKGEQAGGKNEAGATMERRDSKIFWISHIKLRKNSRDALNTETTNPGGKKQREVNKVKENGRQPQSQLTSNTSINNGMADVVGIDGRLEEQELHRTIINGILPLEIGNQETQDSNATVAPQSPRHLPGQPSGSIDTSNQLTVYELYNYFCDGSMYPSIFDPSYLLLLDARPRAEYDRSHIILGKCSASLYRDLLSLSMSGFGFPVREDQIANRLNEFTYVIVYGNAVTDLKNSTLPEIKLMQELMTYEVEPLLLSSGFESFQHTFPFMCTSKEMTIQRNHKEITIYPSLILENQLYLGRGDQATNEKIVMDLKLTHIINISCEHSSPFTDHIQYLNIKLDDVSQSDLKTYFPKAYQFITDAFSSGGRILVHCNLGVSRSSTVVISYLMKNKHLTLKAAHDFVKDRRTCIRPNRGFLQQLGEWEVSIHGKKITDPDDLWF